MNAGFASASNPADGQMAALFGMHALMTLGAKTLQRCADAGHALDTGFPHPRGRG